MKKVEDECSKTHMQLEKLHLRDFSITQIICPIKENKGHYMLQTIGPMVGPVKAHLISWPSKAQNIQNLENIW